MGSINNDIMINGILITPLKQIIDDRGAVFHVLKRSSPAFNQFGEVYISKINFGSIKAWKYHTKMVQNFSVPFGNLKLVLFDDRNDSPTKGLINELILNPNLNYNLVTIPKQIWYGFTCIQPEYSLLLNIASIEHDPDESESLSIKNNLINYNW